MSHDEHEEPEEVEVANCARCGWSSPLEDLEESAEGLVHADPELCGNPDDEDYDDYEEEG